MHEGSVGTIVSTTSTTRYGTCKHHATRCIIRHG